MCEVYIRFPTETMQIPAMSCLDAKISLVPKHQLIVPPTLLAPATHISTDKATKIYTLSLLRYELFFQNSSKKKCQGSFQRGRERGRKIPTNCIFILFTIHSMITGKPSISSKRWMLCSSGKNIYVPLLKYKILMLIFSSSCLLFIFVRFARRVSNKTDPYWLPPLSLSILFENIFFWYKNLLATGSSYLRVLKQLSLSCQTICRRKPAYLQRLQVWTRLPSWNVILFVNFTDENALVSVWQSYLQYNGCNIILYRFCLHIFKVNDNFDISCVHYPTVLETAASTKTK